MHVVHYIKNLEILDSSLFKSFSSCQMINNIAENMRMGDSDCSRFISANEPSECPFENLCLCIYNPLITKSTEESQVT